MEAGFKHPGSAGLTVDRWGDAEPWASKSRLDSDSETAVARVVSRVEEMKLCIFKIRVCDLWIC